MLGSLIPQEQGIHTDPSSGQESLYNHLVIVTEFCDKGDLARVMDKVGARFSEDQAVRHVMWPLLQAMVHMHAQVGGTLGRWVSGMYDAWLGRRPEGVGFTDCVRLYTCM